MNNEKQIGENYGLTSKIILPITNIYRINILNMCEDLCDNE